MLFLLYYFGIARRYDRVKPAQVRCAKQAPVATSIIATTAKCGNWASVFLQFLQPISRNCQALYSGNKSLTPESIFKRLVGSSRHTHQLNLENTLAHESYFLTLIIIYQSVFSITKLAYPPAYKNDLRHFFQ
jgi:hypothetical protein